MKYEVPSRSTKINGIEECHSLEGLGPEGWLLLGFTDSEDRQNKIFKAA